MSETGALTAAAERPVTHHRRSNDGGAVERPNAIRTWLAGTTFTSAEALRRNGLKARHLERGVDGWTATGRPLVDKPSGGTP
jgi:hypothetical protein